MLPELGPTWVAVISALTGGLGLKIVDWWLGRAKVKEDDAANIRSELRTDIKSLRDEIRATKEEAEKNKAAYYEKLEALYASKTELMEAGVRISALEQCVKEWESKYYQLWEDMTPEPEIKSKKVKEVDESSK